MEWGSAGSPSCRHPAVSTDCDGVKSYLERRSDGRYSVEATKLLRAAEGKIASLRRDEELQSEAQEAIPELCRVLRDLDSIAEAERIQRRIDSASGTENLYQKRQYATARIYSSDRRDKLLQLVTRAGIKFSRKHSCTAEEE